MIKVVIADDDFYVREGFSSLLEWEKLGAELVYSASNGKQVINYLEKETVDLLILDIKMPFMTGIEVAKYVNEKMPTTQVVLLSAYADFECAREALSVGIREYILKPINQQKIIRISNIIKEVALETKFTKQIIENMHESEFGKKLNVIISERDYDKLRELLSAPERYKKIDMYRSYCIYILKNFLVAIRAEEDIKEREEHTYQEQLLCCNSINDMKEFTINECTKHIEMENSKYNKNEILTQKIVSYIENNYSNPDLNVQSVADNFDYTADYLTRLFKNQTGISLQEWIIDYRLKQAAKLLENSKLTMRQIANSCGYEQVQYFVRIFKKRNGVTPTEYRQGVRKQ